MWFDSIPVALPFHTQSPSQIWINNQRKMNAVCYKTPSLWHENGCVVARSAQILQLTFGEEHFSRGHQNSSKMNMKNLLSYRFTP